MKLSVVRNHALSLPEATEEPHFDYASFRVRGKIFVTVPPDEEHIHIFLGPEPRAAALDTWPSFLEELKWGKKVLGLRVSLDLATPAVVKRLVSQAWHDKAPKSLHSQHDLKP
jgi:hypothetical protein